MEQFEFELNWTLECLHQVFLKKKMLWAAFAVGSLWGGRPLLWESFAVGSSAELWAVKNHMIWICSNFTYHCHLDRFLAFAYDWLHKTCLIQIHEANFFSLWPEHTCFFHLQFKSKNFLLICSSDGFTNFWHYKSTKLNVDIYIYSTS